MGDPGTARLHIEGARRMITYRNNIRSFESDTLAKEMLFWLVQVLQDHVATSLTTNI
jgi:hypothetical protein